MSKYLIFFFINAIALASSLNYTSATGNGNEWSTESVRRGLESELKIAYQVNCQKQNSPICTIAMHFPDAEGYLLVITANHF